MNMYSKLVFIRELLFRLLENIVKLNM